MLFRSSVFGQSLANGPVGVRDGSGTERLAEVLAGSATQLNLQISPDAALGTARVNSSGQSGDVTLLRVLPGLFAANANGQGPAAATAVHVRADGSLASEFTFRCGSTAGSCANIPIELGPLEEQVVLTLYGTGWRNITKLSDVVVTIGGERAEVLFAGAQPSFLGLDQINVRIPRTLAGRGEVSITVVADGKISNPVSIHVQ